MCSAVLPDTIRYSITWLLPCTMYGKAMIGFVGGCSCLGVNDPVHVWFTDRQKTDQSQRILFKHQLIYESNA